MNYYQDISKEEELARFEEAATAHGKKVTASKEAARDFLIRVGFLPTDYQLPKANKVKAKIKQAKAKNVETIKPKAIKSAKAKVVKAAKIKVSRTFKAKAAA